MEYTEGQVVTLIAGPGYPTESRYTVVGATERVVTAIRTDMDGGPVEVFTRRKNGKYALQGGPQWANYLRKVA